MPDDRSTIAARLNGVREQIARAASRAGRDPSTIRLVAVSKTFGAEHVRLAALAGQVDFGENKLQEATDKMARVADLSLRWHLVGHLQSNKAKKAAAAFDVIHSVDGAALVRKLDEGAAAAGRRVELLVQVDLAGEATKFGAGEGELPAIFAAASACEHVSICGLMTLPPATDNPGDARPYFRRLRAIREQLRADGIPEARLRELSMGMSHDFEVAIEEGATIVRVGTAIFGSRTYP